MFIGGPPPLGAYSLDLPDARFVCHIYHTCEQTSHDGATQRRRGTVLAKNRSLLGAMLSIVTKILFTTGLYRVCIRYRTIYAGSSVYSRALCTGPRDYGTSRPVDSGRQYSGLYPVYIYRNTVHKYIQINHTGEI